MTPFQGKLHLLDNDDSRYGQSAKFARLALMPSKSLLRPRLNIGMELFFCLLTLVGIQKAVFPAPPSWRHPVPLSKPSRLWTHLELLVKCSLRHHLKDSASITTTTIIIFFITIMTIHTMLII
jgi:hypothetical protein